MNRIGSIVLIFVMVIAFAVVSQAIVDVKLLQLRILLSREQVLSYELSSRMLQVKLRQMLIKQNDFSAEIQANVVESSVLNSKDAEKKWDLTPQQVVGLAIVNVVRLLSRKGILNLQSDRNKLVMLQYAFLMERTLKYEKASKKYDDLEKFDNITADDFGFILLHNGYCLTRLGKTPEAIARLQILLDRYPGTHASENAATLIRILKEGQRRELQIAKSSKSESAKVFDYFDAGLYSKVLEKLEGRADLVPKDRFVRARSLEKVGRTTDATKDYLWLVQNGAGDIELERKANRRLSMIGNFYNGGKELSKAAEENAKRLGDEEVIQEIKEGVEKQSKPVVIETILQAAKQAKAEGAETIEGQDDLDLSLIEELQADETESETQRKETVREVVAQLKAVAKSAPPPAVVEEKKKKAEEERRIELAAAPVQRAVRKPPVHKPPEDEVIPENIDYVLYVAFVDGRKLICRSVQLENGMVRIQTSKFPLVVPYSMLAEVGAVARDAFAQDAPVETTVAPRKKLLQLKLTDGGELTVVAIRKEKNTLFVTLDEQEVVEYSQEMLMEILLSATDSEDGAQK